MRRCLLFRFILVALLFYSTNGVVIDCEFGVENHVIGDAYTCMVRFLVVAERNESVEGITGDHLPDMKNRDVKVLVVDDQSLNYFPSDFDNFFPNLKGLKIISSGLRVITQDNLKWFAELQFADFSDNEIESLSGDLFVYNSKLKHISFDNNKIKSIGKNILDVFDDLESVSFKTNECIDESWSQQEGIENAKEKLAKECSSDADPQTDENAWSSMMFDQMKLNPSAIKQNLKDFKDSFSEYQIGNTKVTKMVKITRHGSVHHINFDDDIEASGKSLKVTCDLGEVHWKHSDSELYTCSIPTQPIQYSNYKIDIPLSEGEKVKGLNLNDNKALKYLPEDLGKVFPNLVELSAKGTYLETISGNVFDGLGKLKKLTLSNNDMNVIENESFAGLGELEVLDLSEGNINFIEEGAFSGLKSLKTLHLGGNKLHYLEPKTFEGLTELRNISLELNHIADIDENLLRTNTKLENVWLNGNKLNIASPKMFDGLNNLAYVDMQGNECIDGVFGPTTFDEMKSKMEENCASTYVIRHTYKTYTVKGGENHKKIRNEAHTEVTADDGTILEITQDVSVQEDDETFTEELTTEGVPKSTEIKNNLGTKTVSCDIEDMTWPLSGDNLKTCVIKDQAIDGKDFTLTETMDGVGVEGFSIFDGKLIKFLPENISQILPNLSEMSIRNSSLVYLTRESFDGLSNLKTLNLANNKIRFIEPDTFDDLKELEDLDLSGNSMEYLDENIFLKLKSLKRLHLGDNKLHFIHPKLFRNLRNMQNISISGNQLSTLDENLFKTNQKLKNIWMHNNKIKSMSPNMFSSPKGLEYVDLRDNKCITSVYEKSEFEKMKTEILEKCGDGYVLKHGKKTKEKKKKEKTSTTTESNVELKEIGCEYDNIFWPSLNRTLFTCVVTSDESIDDPNFIMTVNINPNDPVFTDGDTVEALTFMPNKNIKFLPKNIGEAFPNLVVMSASSDSLTTVAKDHFKGLPKLKSLNLSGNQIKSFEPNTFEDLTNLEELILEDNEIEYIEVTTVIYLKKLKKFKVAGNKLSKIDPEMFDEMTELVEVTIELEDPSEANEKLFKTNPNLKSVKLNGKLLGPDLQPIDDNEGDVNGQTTEIPLTETTTTTTSLDEKENREVQCSFIQTFSQSANANVLTCELPDEEDLQESGYTIKPSYQTSKVTRFQINNVQNIKYLPDNMNEAFPNLIEISASNNNIVGVNRKNLEGLKHLKFLHLSGNNIKHVESDTFDDLESLEELDMSDNVMEFLEETLLYKLKNLKQLKMNGNKIHHIHSKTFKHLGNLEDISLAGNKLSVVEPFTFRQNQKLKTVDLSSNNIESLDPKLFANSKDLQTVNFDGNKCIEGVFESSGFNEMKKKIKENCQPEKSIEGSEEEFTCEFDAIDGSCVVKDQTIETSEYTIKANSSDMDQPMIDGSEVKRLVINGPNVQFLPKLISKEFPNLIEIESDSPLSSISKENFDNLPNLKTLKLKAVESIEPDTFYEQTSLEHLEIEPEIEEIDEHIFSKLHSLKTLYLISKTLKTINPNAFIEMPELEVIKLNYYKLGDNEPKEIGNHLTRNNPNLKVIKINDEDIKDEVIDEIVDLEPTEQPTVIPTSKSKVLCEYETIYDHETGLRNLICNLQNQIINDPETEIDESSQSSNVHTVDFSYNKNINFLPKNLHQSFPNLVRIIGKDAAVTNVSPDALKDLNSLLKLDLSKNEIKSVDPNTFSDLKSLVELDLSHNDIKTFDEHTFDPMVSLKTLSINDNELNSLNENSFRYLPELQHVHFEGNNLPLINEDELFRYNPVVENVKISIKNTLKPEATTSRTMATSSSQTPAASKERKKGSRKPTISSNYRKLKPTTTTTTTTLKTPSNEVACQLQYADWPGDGTLITCDLKDQTIINFDTVIQPNPYSDHVQALRIDNNKNAEYLPENMAQAFPNLRRLSAKNSSIKAIFKIDLENLKNLKTLDLSGNNIETIEQETFADLTNLEELNLDDNKIDYVDENAFPNLKSLNTLDLSGNKIKSINPNTFENLPELTSLNLEGNQLPYISREVYFRNNPKLKDLKLTFDNNLVFTTSKPMTSRTTTQRGSDFSTPRSPRTTTQRSFPSSTLRVSIFTTRRPSFTTTPRTSQPTAPWEFITERQEVPCNYGDTYYLGSNLFTCNLKDPINDVVTIMSSPRNVRVKSLNLIDNKDIKFLPENLSEEFPNLIGILAFNSSIESVNPQSFKDLHKLKYLNLAKNNLKMIAPESFSDLTMLEDLDLSDNEIEEIDESTFNKLSSLKSLALGGNKFKHLPAEVFRYLPELRNLSLENSMLTNIDPSIFKNNPKLENIWLNGNKMKFIDPKTFDSLTNLEYVDLQRNECIDQYFEGLSLQKLKTELKKMCLNDDVNVKPTEFPSDTKPSIPKAKKQKPIQIESSSTAYQVPCRFKYVKWPNVNTTLYTCVINDQSIDGPDYVIKSTPYPTNAQAIEIKGKKVKQIPKNISQMFPNLINFSVKNTSISELHPETFKDLTKLKLIHLPDNKLEEIDPAVFSGLTSLEDLNLNHNRIKRIASTAFPENIKNLDLSNNLLKSFEPKTIENLQHLTTINLSGNGITKIEPDTFENNVHLKEILLSGNKIKSIIPETFAKLPDLKTVNLEENDCISGFFTPSSFKTLSLEMSRNCKPVPTTDLDNERDEVDTTNWIQQPTNERNTFEIPAENLYGIPDDDSQKRVDPNEEFVDLSIKKFMCGAGDNQETEVSCKFEDTFSPFFNTYLFSCTIENQPIVSPYSTFKQSPENKRVKRMVFSENKDLKNLPSFVGQSFPNLLEFNARNSSLRKVRPETFRDLPHLKSLDLSGNDLTNIEPGTFDELPSLEELSLSQNEIKFIDEPNIESLKVLNLDENELQFLDSKVLSKLPQLMSLNLEGNQLPKIDERTFKFNPHLEVISLNKNKLESVGPKTFGNLPRLKSLDLRENECIDKSFVADSMNLVGKALRDNCNPRENLLRLLNSCKLEVETCKSSKAPKSVNFEMTNLIKENEKLKSSLKVYEGKVDQLNLVLLRNRNVKNSEKVILQRLKEKTKNLAIENEKLRNDIKICAKTDANHNFLVDLDCKFEEVGLTRDYTCAAQNLKVLSEDTTVQDVLGSHKRGKENSLVTSLVITDQTMKFVPSGIAEFFPNLQELIILNSTLSKIGPKSFNELKNLKRLIIRGNKINSIEPDSLDNNQYLELLDITGNNIDKLPSKAFEKLTNLKTLHLNNNAIKTLSSDIIASPNAIEDFSVNENKLESIDPRLLKRLVKSKTIDFNSNACVDRKFSVDDDDDQQAMILLFGEIAMKCSDDKLCGLK